MNLHNAFLILLFISALSAGAALDKASSAQQTAISELVQSLQSAKKVILTGKRSASSAQSGQNRNIFKDKQKFILPEMPRENNPEEQLQVQIREQRQLLEQMRKAPAADTAAQEQMANKQKEIRENVRKTAGTPSLPHGTAQSLNRAQNAMKESGKMLQSGQPSMAQSAAQKALSDLKQAEKTITDDADRRMRNSLADAQRKLERLSESSRRGTATPQTPDSLRSLSDRLLNDALAQHKTGRQSHAQDLARLAQQIHNAASSREKTHSLANLIAEIRELRRSLKSMPYSDQMDDSYKRICYIRYADDFLIGVIGSKGDAEQIKQDVGCFIREKLHLEMSREKTLITHGHDFAKFLGYEVTIAKGEYNKKTKTGATRRVNNGKVLLYVPHDKWVKRLFSYNALKIKYDKQNGNKEVWEPVRRTRLLHLDDLEILNQYNTEIRGLYNYYRLANNVSVLNNFYYVMRYSMLKTFAGKYRTRISRIIRKYRKGKDFAVEYLQKNGKVGQTLFYNKGFRRDTKVGKENPDIVARAVENYGSNSLIKRLKANKCEWCGAENMPLEMHHIRKLKDLKGRKQWEIAMIGRKRKTMALCVNCHDKLHAGKLD